MSRFAVLQGGHSLERQVSLKSGARVDDALERLGHEVIQIDVGADLVQRLSAARPDAAFVAMHGRDGEDGTVQELLDLVGIPYTGSGPFACQRCWDKVHTKHALVEAGIPTPAFHAFSQTAFRELGAAHALPAIEERLEFPLVIKPASQGSALGIKFAQAPADVPGALLTAFSYDTKALLERHVDGRDLAVSILDGPTARRRCRSSRRSPTPTTTSTTSSRATRSAARRSRVRPSCLRAPPSGSRRWRSRRTSCSAATASRAWT